MHQETEEKVCRICLDNDNINDLFSPCKCKGSIKYIHKSCLEEWRKQGSKQFFKCPNCKYSYRLSRMKYANLLQSQIIITIVTIISILTCVIVVAYMIKFFALLFFGLKLTRSAFALSSRIVWWSVLVIGCVFMLIALFFSDGDGRNSLVNIFQGFQNLHPVVVEYFGYTFSLSGFSLFIVYTYNSIRDYFALLLTRCGQYVLDVSE